MKIPFVGGSYTGISKHINSQRSVNVYPVLDNQGGKAVAALYGTPGLKPYADSGVTAPVRGLWEFNDVLYAVIGGVFYQVSADGLTFTSKGTLNTSTGYVWIEDNGVQIMVVDGTDGYIYDGSTFTQIADADFPGAASLAYQDGYFIVIDPNTDDFYISASYDGTSWNALDFGTAEGSPDNALSLIADHRETVVAGKKSTEIFYNSGNVDFPLERVPGGYIEMGIIAPASLTKKYDSVYWLNENRQVSRMSEYRPSLISTPQVDHQFRTYSTVSDAIGWTYVQDGHVFYMLTFPSEGKTWAYDIATGFWHERSSYPNDGRHRANCHVHFNGKELVGDYENGIIYEYDFDTYTDNGEILKRLRQAQILHSDRKRVFNSLLELEFESGVGLNSGQGSDPQVMLRYSDDNGNSYSNEQWRSIGKKGKYKNRARWKRISVARNRVYEVSMTDPVKFVLIDAQLDAMVGK